MREETVKAVFCGVLPSGSANAFMQFVMGKVDEEAFSVRRADIVTMDRLFIDTFNERGIITLTEPIMIHRVPGMWQDPKTGDKQMVVTHQFIEDPYWPIRRGLKMPFNLGIFLSARIMDQTHPKDMEEIARYETSLEKSFSDASGLVKLGSIR